MADNGTPPEQEPVNVSQIMVYAESVAPRVHAGGDDGLGVLDLAFAFGDSICTIRLPAVAWTAIRDSVERAFADAASEAQRAAVSGIVLPGNVDKAYIDRTAEALAKADDELRGGHKP